jgi:hypothetical protein
MKFLKFLPLTATLAISGTLNASPIQLITNGGFETGDFTGWTVTDLLGGSGAWFIDDTSGVTPLSGEPTVGPAGGSFYAVTDQTGPGTHALSQSFLVPFSATSVIVSFDMFMNDWSDAGPLDLGLDHTTLDNQHARVDIMDILAGAFSTNPADIIASLIPPTTDGLGNPHAYTAYSFDITSFVIGGNSYTLRFGEVDNLSFFNAGVDNIKVLANSADVPEPTSLALLGLGLGFIGMTAKRRAKA